MRRRVMFGGLGGMYFISLFALWCCQTGWKEAAAQEGTGTWQEGTGTWTCKYEQVQNTDFTEQWKYLKVVTNFEHVMIVTYANHGSIG